MFGGQRNYNLVQRTAGLYPGERQGGLFAKTGNESETRPFITSTNDEDDDERKRRYGFTNGQLFCCLAILCLLVIGGIALAILLTNNASSSSTTTTTIASTTTTAGTLVFPGFSATPPPSDAVLSLESLCNIPFLNGTCRVFVTYMNRHDSSLTILAGEYNSVNVPGHDGDQPQVFRPGKHYGGASFAWNCSTLDQLEWSVTTHGVTSSARVAPSAMTCPPVPLL